MFDLKWSYNNKFIFTFFDREKNQVSFSCFDSFSTTNFSQFSILNELVENGLAEIQNGSVHVETLQILSLEEIDKCILNLPDLYPYELVIRSFGQLNQDTFKYIYSFFEFYPHGNLLPSSHDGPCVIISDRVYLLSLNQYKLCNAIDDFNSLPTQQKTFSNNLFKFSSIKELSKDSSSILDAYLNSQTVIHPDKIHIHLEYNNNTLEIIPVIDTPNQDKFLNSFDTFSEIRDNYAFTEGINNTTRILFNPQQKNALRKIKKFRKINDNELISSIVEKPSNYFDDDIIDISVFYSDRVKEIGVYKPKFYPFICPYKSQWIPGFETKDINGTSTKLFIKSIDDLNELERSILLAESQNSTVILWKNNEIPIETAKKGFEIAKKQLKNPEVPSITKEAAVAEKVLIIKENAEYLEYCEEIKIDQNIKYSFFQINNLNSNVNLKKHQVEGIAWLQSISTNFPGCLLADDMGLGKTLQVLYFIEWHSQFKNSTKPYLVVAPLSLLENWQNEYQKYFCPPSLDIFLLYGNVSIEKYFSEESVRILNKKHLILTNYETVKSYQFNICAVDFSVVVLDEAQKIKTPGTLVTNVSKALKSDFKVAMTGTPVENTLLDIWSIMDFALPGFLGNAKEFAKEYLHSLKNESTDIIELGKRLRAKIGFFINRRIKSDVLIDLPIKHDDQNSKIERAMPQIQIDRYKMEIELCKSSVLENNSNPNKILLSLNRIKAISDHPFLPDSQLLKYSSKELIASSAKLQVVIELLNKISSVQEKVIIFTDRKEIQKMLQKVISDSFDVFPSIINGDSPVIQLNSKKAELSRQQTIDYFQNKVGFNVIIMSQLAAGIGLNVTAANHVIHYSRHWNPAKESQATDRVYRLGQEREVFVYYPMAVSAEFRSFDLVLDNLLNRKKTLANSTLFPTEQVEINPDDLYRKIFGEDLTSPFIPLQFDDIDKLNPDLFEALIAALYLKMGYSTFLTPFSNDKGADVVVIGERTNYLIQVKQSKNAILNNAVQEIATSKAFYEKIFNVSFNLVVATNSYLSESAKVLADLNNVLIIDRVFLKEKLSQHPLSMIDLHKQEQFRMKSVSNSII